MATLNIKNFPEPLYEALKAWAEQENRSVAQQVIQLLSEAVKQREPTSILELRGLGKEAWRGLDAGEHVRAERDSWD